MLPVDKVVVAAAADAVVVAMAAKTAAAHIWVVHVSENPLKIPSLKKLPPPASLVSIAYLTS